MRLRGGATRPELRCENCGMPLTPDNVYVREIMGIKHYFCCEHCANAFEERLRRGGR
jgi:hypothetical protein